MTAVYEATLDSLVHLICGGDKDGREYYAPIHRLKAADFDGFEPFFRDDLDDDNCILVGKGPADQPVWPIDLAFAYPARDEGWPAGSWQFTRYKTLRPSEWRGVIHKFYPRMIDHLTLIAQPDGTHESARVPFAIVGNKIIDVKRAISGMRIDTAAAGGVSPGWFGQRENWRLSGQDAEEMPFMISMLGGIALRRRYHWSVLLGEGKGPRARFVSDVTGIREVFRFRDIPSGKERRAALLHWVKAHWRKRRKPSANDRAWVRQHLRGAWSYTWNGLICQIEPGEYDLEQLLEGAEE